MADLDQLKNSIAAEIGLPDFDQMDKSKIPSQVTGKIGGQMVKRMMALAQQQLEGGGSPPNLK